MTKRRSHGGMASRVPSINITVFMDGTMQNDVPSMKTPFLVDGMTPEVELRAG